MPKELTSKTLILPKASPYSPKPDLKIQHRSTIEEVKEWEEARCPICIEHPHNAVLLKCSSHDTGCRPYICDTSYRHSNCLDQFKKLFEASEGLQCPFCRGPVSNLVAAGPARQLLDLKERACSCEGCDFAGTYQELRAHARALHPLARPSLVDAQRRGEWARKEEEWVMNDLISIQTAGVHDFDLSDDYYDDDDDLIPQSVVLESYHDARNNLSPRMIVPEGYNTSSSDDDAIDYHRRPRRSPARSRRDTRRGGDDVSSSDLRPRRIPESRHGSRRGGDDIISLRHHRRVVSESYYYVSDDLGPRRGTGRGRDDVSSLGLHRRVVSERHHRTRSGDVSNNLRPRRRTEPERSRTRTRDY